MPASMAPGSGFGATEVEGLGGPSSTEGFTWMITTWKYVVMKKDLGLTGVSVKAWAVA